MRQYHLTGSELPEIGDKTMVSKVQNGKRTLTRQAIEKLSARSNVKPANSRRPSVHSSFLLVWLNLF